MVLSPVFIMGQCGESSLHGSENPFQPSGVQTVPLTSLLCFSPFVLMHELLIKLSLFTGTHRCQQGCCLFCLLRKENDVEKGIRLRAF